MLRLSARLCPVSQDRHRAVKKLAQDPVLQITVVLHLIHDQMADLLLWEIDSMKMRNSVLADVLTEAVTHGSEAVQQKLGEVTSRVFGKTEGITVAEIKSWAETHPDSEGDDKRYARKESLSTMAPIPRPK